MSSIQKRLRFPLPITILLHVSGLHTPDSIRCSITFKCRGMHCINMTAISRLNFKCKPIVFNKTCIFDLSGDASLAHSIIISSHFANIDLALSNNFIVYSDVVGLWLRHWLHWEFFVFVFRFVLFFFFCEWEQYFRLDRIFVQ